MPHPLPRFAEDRERSPPSGCWDKVTISTDEDVSAGRSGSVKTVTRGLLGFPDQRRLVSEAETLLDLSSVTSPGRSKRAPRRRSQRTGILLHPVSIPRTHRTRSRVV
jgi:hypothetical protein